MTLLLRLSRRFLKYHVVKPEVGHFFSFPMLNAQLESESYLVSDSTSKQCIEKRLQFNRTSDYKYVELFLPIDWVELFEISKKLLINNFLKF